MSDHGRLFPKGSKAKSGALILTRRLGQGVWIEHGLLKIQVIQLSGKTVRLRFEGNVKVDREEIALRELGEQEGEPNDSGGEV